MHRLRRHHNFISLRLVSLLLAGALWCSAVVVCATSMEDLETQKQQAEEDVERLTEEAETISGEKSSLEAALQEKLDEISTAETALAEAGEQLEATRAVLAEKQEEEELHRQMVALRVKFVYEQGHESWLSVLLSSGSFASFLNRLDAMEQMSAYDQRLLEEMREVQEELAKTELELTERQHELETARQTLDEERAQLEELLAQASEALRSKYSEVSNARAAVAEIEDQIQEFERANQAQAAANAQALLDQLHQMALAAGIPDDPVPVVTPAPSSEAAAGSGDGSVGIDDVQEGGDAMAGDTGSDAAGGSIVIPQGPSASPSGSGSAAASGGADVSDHSDAAGASTLPSWMQLASDASVGYYTVAAMSYTEEELNEMAAIIYSEARGEPYMGKVAVASVILNRVRSPRFAQNDIISVIHAPKQFEPVSTGHHAQIRQWALEGKFAEDKYYIECRQAAVDALNGTRTTNLCFFWAVWLADRYDLPGLDIGGHRFFGWVTCNE